MGDDSRRGDERVFFVCIFLLNFIVNLFWFRLCFSVGRGKRGRGKKGRGKKGQERREDEK